LGLTFVVGTAADVFSGDLARAVDGALHARFSFGTNAEEKYESEPVDASGWRELQRRVHQALAVAPHLTSVDAYQAVYLPANIEHVEHVPIPNVADPLQVASLPALLEELHRFAASTSLPTDDLELMKLGAHYLESDDFDADLDVQTYVQLMLSAKQASARGQALWIVV
jgi:hypothetical protein